jgi:polyphosphate kinase
MERAGIKIIYSIPGLKVHAKVSVILRSAGHPNFAYLGTGNFNERTAKLYSDLALLTCNQAIVEDMDRVFALLEGSTEPPVFSHLLVSPFNMSDRITQLIRRESSYARSGHGGRIILKMNGLHDRHMIDELYMASESGVEIDLIVRGICCLIPGQSFSSRIRVTRIVDVYLEHARIWYFGAGGDEEVFLTSADWMNRNLNRRIETAVPILDKTIKRQIIDILSLQLRDNVKACFIDADLRNVFKRDLSVDFAMPVRAQEATYEYIQNLATEEKEQGEAPQPSLP